MQLSIFTKYQLIEFTQAIIDIRACLIYHHPGTLGLGVTFQPNYTYIYLLCSNEGQFHMISL